MKQNEIKEYRLLYVENGEVRDNGIRWGTLEQLQSDFPGDDERQWAMIPADGVSENWQEMTIEDGKLVPAPAEVLEARHVARQQAEAEAVRAARESRYRTETDALMYDAVEAYAIAHPDDPAFAAWLQAKNRIRRELPKSQKGGGDE